MSTKLSIRFGLVVLPVALDAGARADRVSFKQMALDGGGIEQRLVSKKTGQEVPRTELRKAAEVGKTLVEIPAAELAALEGDPNKAIDILSFVPTESVDALYYEDSHYLKPQTGGENAFALLFDVLKRKGRTAIAKAWLNGAEHVVAIRAAAGGLVLQKLFYQNEVRMERAYRPDTSTLPEAQVKMAEMLVDGLAAPAFDPSLYHDEYSAKLRKLIASKVAVVDPAAGVPAAMASANLMEQMMASLEALRKPVEGEQPKQRVSRKRSNGSQKGQTVSQTVEIVSPPAPIVSLLDQIVEAHQEAAA
jgi:DNA end-binding protein Ku